MTVEPGDRCGNECKDNSMCDELPDLILIETLVGCTVQLGERLVQAIGNRLTLTLIDIGGQTDAQDGDNRRCGSNLRIEVDGVVGTSGRHIATEATAPSEEATQCGVDTHTHGDHTEYNQGNGHRSRSLMGRMVLMSLNILCTPEDTVVETEHIEGRHGGDACHDPTHHRTAEKNGIPAIARQLMRKVI